MRLVLRSGIVIALALWAIGPGLAQAADDGKTIYTKKCASCHGEKGEGKEAIFKALKADVKALSAPEVQKKTDEQLAKETLEGVGKMKPVKLSADETKAVVAYLRTLKQ